MKCANAKLFFFDTLPGLWDLGSPPRDQTFFLCSGGAETTREDPAMLLHTRPWSTPSLNTLALPRLTAMLLGPGFLLCVPTLTIHLHFCTNLPDTYFCMVCKTRWKWSRQARHLPLRAGSFLWSQFALASSHPSYPSERLPHSRLWLSSTSRITVVDLIWHFYHYSFLPISLSLVMESSVSRQPALTPHPTHAAWPQPAFVPGTLSHRPDLLAGFIRTAWPLVHDPQPFKACAICPFPSYPSGRLSATCCQAPHPASV